MSITRVEISCPHCRRTYRLRLDREKLERTRSTARCGRCRKRFSLTMRLADVEARRSSRPPAERAVAPAKQTRELVSRTTGEGDRVAGADDDKERASPARGTSRAAEVEVRTGVTRGDGADSATRSSSDLSEHLVPVSQLPPDDDEHPPLTDETSAEPDDGGKPGSGERIAQRAPDGPRKRRSSARLDRAALTEPEPTRSVDETDVLVAVTDPVSDPGSGPGFGPDEGFDDDSMELTDDDGGRLTVYVDDGRDKRSAVKRNTLPDWPPGGGEHGDRNPVEMGGAAAAMDLLRTPRRGAAVGNAGRARRLSSRGGVAMIDRHAWLNFADPGVELPPPPVSPGAEALRALLRDLPDMPE